MGFPRQEYWSGLPFPFSRESSWPRDQTCISCIAGRFFTTEPPRKPEGWLPGHRLQEQANRLHGQRKAGFREGPGMSSASWKSQGRWGSPGSECSMETGRSIGWGGEWWKENRTSDFWLRQSGGGRTRGMVGAPLHPRQIHLCTHLSLGVYYS